MSTFNIARAERGFALTYFLQNDSHKTVEIAFKAIPIPFLEAASDFGCYAQRVEQHPSYLCCDVQPINGNQSKRFLKSLIRPNIVSELQSQMEYSNSRLTASRVHLFVLDIKDAKGCYINEAEIENAENEFAFFLQKPEPKELSPRKTFHQIVRNKEIAFFLREGKLKHDIVSQLTGESAEFLQNSDRGRKELCELCEMVMNFFKMGFAVEGLPKALHPQNYFVSTAVRKEQFSGPLELRSIHSISLMTFYPSHYREMYSQQGEYYLAMNSVFKTRHDYEQSTKTTAISIAQ
jgi:hypothetical protein